jgi:hypothetical protein
MGAANVTAGMGRRKRGLEEDILRLAHKRTYQRIRAAAHTPQADYHMAVSLAVEELVDDCEAFVSSR